MIDFQQNRERIFNNFISEYSGATNNQQRKNIVLNKLYKPLKQSQHIVSNYSFILNKNNIIPSTSNDDIQSYGRFTRFRYNRSGQFDLSVFDNELLFGNTSGFAGGTVNTITIDNNNKILVGGSFTSYQGQTRNRIIRLNQDGSIDNTFDIGTGFNSTVNTITIDNNNKILVGGSFTSYQGQTRNRIIRLNDDGSIDNTFDIGTGFNGGVLTITIDNNNKILVGGQFTTYQDQTRNRIIKLNDDGSIDNTFNIGSGFNSQVMTITINNNKIYVGGWFVTYQGQTRNRIIRLNQDGSIDNTFNIGSGFSDFVNTIGIDNNDKIVLGGQFTTYQGQTRNRIIRLNQDGSIDNTFDIGSGFNDTVNTIGIDNNDKIYIGGQFTTYQGQTRNRIIRLNQDGSIDNTFDIGTGFNGAVNIITIDNNNKILVGGSFTSYQGQTRNRIVRLNQDDSIDNTFDISTGFDSDVLTITIDNNDKIVLGGQFTTYQGQTRNRIIRLNQDGSIDNTFDIGTGFNGGVLTITIDNNNKILVGGDFTSYQGQTRIRIVRLNQDGSIDNTFDIGTGFAGGTVNTIVIDNNNKIYVGGGFTQYQGQTRNRIIRLNQDGSIDNTFDIGTGFNSVVNTIGIDNNDKIVLGGQFTTYQGQTRNRIIRLNQDGSIDNTFNIGSGFGGNVNTIGINNNNKIYVGGGFTSYQGQTRNRIIRLNQDGSIDNTFDIGTGFNNTLFSITIDNNNKILVGGNFTSYQGQTRNRIIRLNDDGSRDTDFDIGTGFNNTVNTITIDNNKIYVGGNFINYNNINKTSFLVVLNNLGGIAKVGISEEEFENIIDENINPVTTNFKEINEGLSELINLFIEASPNDKSFALGTYLDYIAMKKDEIDYINQLINEYRILFTFDELQIVERAGLKYFD